MNKGKLSKTEIFRKGSTTYYYSSILFPKDIKDDVFTLYAFVRTADDYVDAIPQMKKSFLKFKEETKKAFDGKSVNNPIISEFKEVCDKRGIPYSWVESFLAAMESDLKKSVYNSFSELEQYMYGSAEVIGLFMAQIMNLPKKSHKYAQLQGKAMQVINFIRDIEEDIALKRQYLPTKDLKNIGIKTIDELKKDKQKLKDFVMFQLERYHDIQNQAYQGYSYIPRKYRIMIKTAADLYNWTAQEIKKDPTIIFRKKVKPSKPRIILTLFKNFIVA